LADDQVLIHATCVALGEKGILIMGSPGSGKSDLALRLIDFADDGRDVPPQPAELVSDDQTLITRRGNRLFASSPATIAGKLEVRGIGVIGVANRKEAALALAVMLMPAAEIERMPAEGAAFELLGVALPQVCIDAAAASAPARLRAALRHMAAR